MKTSGSRVRCSPSPASTLFTPTGESPAKVSSGQIAEPNRGTSRVLPWKGSDSTRAGRGFELRVGSTVAAKMTVFARSTMWEKVSSNEV